MKQFITNIVSLVLMANMVCAGAVEFKRQTIRISSDKGQRLWPRFEDIDDDGLSDLLALVGVENRLRVYRQHASGFAATPEQTIELPQHTAWVAMHDVDPHQGEELLISTARGLAYLRQDQGVFEHLFQTLIEADQVFTTDHPPIGVILAKEDDANGTIPVIFEDHTVLYGINGRYECIPKQRIALDLVETKWSLLEDNNWSIGPNPEHRMYIRTYFRANPEDSPTEEKAGENKAIQNLIKEVENSGKWYEHRVERRDVNNDGREDLVLCMSGGELDPRTNVLLFLRGENGRLPEKPTQILRCRGLPIRIDRTQGVSPVCDLDGDGVCELVLVALKTKFTSWSSLVDMAISRGIDWVFTARSFKDGAYSKGPDFRTDMTTMLPVDESIATLFLLEADFNGDGRRDILVKRLPTQYEVFLSSAGAGWFESEPALTFETPIEGYLDTRDLNSDGLSDMCVQGRDDACITVFLSKSENRKGTPK